MYQWIVYVHMLAGLAFFLAHGAAATLAFRLRQETDLDRIKTLLDMSPTMLPVYGISLIVQLIAGIVSGFMLDWWRQGWICVALGLLIALIVWMYLYAQAHYHPLRKAIGQSYMLGSKQMPAEPPASAEAIQAIITQTNPRLLTVIGFGVPALILYLMMFKPF